jgi:hypothetical protein
MRNVEESSSGKKEMIVDRNLDQHNEMKRTGICG